MFPRLGWGIVGTLNQARTARATRLRAEPTVTGRCHTTSTYALRRRLRANRSRLMIYSHERKARDQTAARRRRYYPGTSDFIGRQYTAQDEYAKARSLLEEAIGCRIASVSTRGEPPVHWRRRCRRATFSAPTPSSRKVSTLFLTNHDTRWIGSSVWSAALKLQTTVATRVMRWRVPRQRGICCSGCRFAPSLPT